MMDDKPIQKHQQQHKHQAQTQLEYELHEIKVSTLQDATKGKIRAKRDAKLKGKNLLEIEDDVLNQDEVEN